MPNEAGEIDPSDEAVAKKVQTWLVIQCRVIIEDWLENPAMGREIIYNVAKESLLENIWYYMGGVSFGHIKRIFISTREILEPP